ncbi:MarR family transcriptional regulator, partial [Mesorhizobium sp. M1A.F.Ca.IN.020.03.1.1]
YGASIAELMSDKLSAKELETLAALLGRLREPPAGD